MLQAVNMVQQSANNHVTSAHKILLQYMPRECVIVALIGSCQLYGTIWLQSFSTGFSPLMFLFGYTAGFSHLMLSGMVVNRKKIERDKKNYILKLLIGITCISCMLCSSGIIYFLKDSEGHLILIIINSYAIIVVIIWAGIVTHVIGRIIAKITSRSSKHDVEVEAYDQAIDRTEIFQGV